MLKPQQEEWMDTSRTQNGQEYVTVGSSESEVPAQATSLCLACGFCCNGTLHPWARLEPHEIPLIESMGLTLQSHKDLPVFRMPCPCWSQEGCSVYLSRPTVCQKYRCKLLEAMDRRKVTADTAFERVKLAKRIVATIEAIIGDDSTTDSIWQRVEHFAQRHGFHHESTRFTAAFPLLALNVGSLKVVLNHHFLHSKPEESTT